MVRQVLNRDKAFEFMLEMNYVGDICYGNMQIMLYCYN